MKLKVYWGNDDEADYQIPKELRWEDGSLAEMEDYKRLQHATQSDFETEDGLMTVIAPDVFAVARFDMRQHRWFLEGPEGAPFYLQETDPEVSDEVLDREIASYIVRIEHLIDRSHVRETAVDN